MHGSSGLPEEWRKGYRARVCLVWRAMHGRAQESLGGNAKTSLVIAVANAFEHGDETLQSLQFGTRAMRVRTQAVVNERDNFRVINAELARPVGACCLLRKPFFGQMQPLQPVL